MGKKKILISAALGLVILVLVGVNLLNVNKAALVQSIEVTEGVITEEVFANGKLEPVDTAQLYAPVSGVVEAVAVKLGDTITKGQELLTLNMESVQEQLDKELLNLQMVEAERLQAKKQHFESFKQARSLDADTEPEELDLTSYDLRIKSSELNIESLKRQLASSSIKAEKGGVVTELAVQKGQMIAQGNLIVSIADFSAYQVRSNLNELDAGKVQAGMKAVVTSESFAGEFNGQVTYLAPVAQLAEATSKDPSVEMLVRLDEISPELKSGYNASLTLEIPDKPRLLVPIQAIQYEGEETFIFKVEEGQPMKAVKVPVQVGKEGEEQVEIVSGVSKGEKIIIEGTEGLRDGDKVKLQ